MYVLVLRMKWVYICVQGIVSRLSDLIDGVTSHSGLATWLAAIVSVATFVKTLLFKKSQTKSGQKWESVGDAAHTIGPSIESSPQ